MLARKRARRNPGEDRRGVARFGRRKDAGVQMQDTSAPTGSKKKRQPLVNGTGGTSDHSQAVEESFPLRECVCLTAPVGEVTNPVDPHPAPCRRYLAARDRAKRWEKSKHPRLLLVGVSDAAESLKSLDGNCHAPDNEQFSRRLKWDR